MFFIQLLILYFTFSIHFQFIFYIKNLTNFKLLYVANNNLFVFHLDFVDVVVDCTLC